jgi:hypothetical protein
LLKALDKKSLTQLSPVTPGIEAKPLPTRRDVVSDRESPVPSVARGSQGLNLDRINGQFDWTWAEQGSSAPNRKPDITKAGDGCQRKFWAIFQSTELAFCSKIWELLYAPD